MAGVRGAITHSGIMMAKTPHRCRMRIQPNHGRMVSKLSATPVGTAGPGCQVPSISGSLTASTELKNIEDEMTAIVKSV